MSRIESEQRVLRVTVSGYLYDHGWSDLNFSEGWSYIDIEKPLVNTYVIDLRKTNLEIGNYGSQHKLFERVAQFDVYMESENRVRAVCEDIMDYLDAASVTIVDNFTTSGIGYLIFPNSERISAKFIPPSALGSEILRWRGVVTGDFEAYYPNGGEPL